MVLRQMTAKTRVPIVWSFLFLVTGTAGLEAGHNKMLQREFRAAISRHVAGDRQGNWLSARALAPVGKRARFHFEGFAATAPGSDF